MWILKTIVRIMLFRLITRGVAVFVLLVGIVLGFGLLKFPELRGVLIGQARQISDSLLQSAIGR
jgi:hypothetical protein